MTSSGATRASSASPIAALFIRSACRSGSWSLAAAMSCSQSRMPDQNSLGRLFHSSATTYCRYSGTRKSTCRIAIGPELLATGTCLTQSSLWLARCLRSCRNLRSISAFAFFDPVSSSGAKSAKPKLEAGHLILEDAFGHTEDEGQRRDL